MTQPDLFEPSRYPNSPGHRNVDTSIAAAEAVKPKAATLRAGVLECLRKNPDGLTADECAVMMGESVLAVRPRVTELHKAPLNKIIATGQKRKNVTSGLMAKVWCLR